MEYYCEVSGGDAILLSSISVAFCSVVEFSIMVSCANVIASTVYIHGTLADIRVPSDDIARTVAVTVTGTDGLGVLFI